MPIRLDELDMAADDQGDLDKRLRARIAELEAENARLRTVFAKSRVHADDTAGHDREVAASRAELAGAEELIAGLQQANLALDRSRAALEESEARYRAVLESATEHAIITMDKAGRITGWSPGAVAILGWEANEVLGRDSAFIWTEEDRIARIPEAERRKALKTGCMVEERWHLRRDGSRFWGSGRLSRLQKESVAGFVKILRDDTASRRAMEVTRESEARLAAIFGAAAVGLCEISPKGFFLRVNEELCRILGRSRQELQRMGVADVTHPDDLERSFQTLGEVLESKGMTRLDKRYLRPDGSQVWANSSISALLDEAGQVRSLLVVTADLTERHEAETAVRESEDRLRNLVSASSEVMYATNPDWTVLRRLDGEGLFADTDQLNADWFEYYVHPDDQPMVRSAIRAGILSKSVIEVEHRFPRSGGSFGWVLSRAVPVLDATGDIREWFGAASDVTARKEAEAALLEQKERFRLLVMGMPQLVWRSANEGEWTWSSPQWCTYTGQSVMESLGRGWLSAVHPDDRAATMEAWHEAPRHGKLTVELRIRCAADGAWRWHQTRSLPVRDIRRPGRTEGRITEWIGTCTDIEDLMRLQHRQEILVAELQHRTRNLLTVIRSILVRTLPHSQERDEIDGRLAALGRVQGFLGRTAQRPISLAELVAAELTATGIKASQRSVVAGPLVELSDDKVQPLALALHELATNAVKYGALAQPAAKLSITWRFETREGNEHLLLEWRESGVAMPPAAAPRRRGFGTELIQRALPYQMRGEAELTFRSDGVHCLISLPADAVQGIEIDASSAVTIKTIHR
ncbi:PAS domain S-box protein [Roseomonas vastitatis]|uniref:histidine kinase n=2 Tax=Teichococcus vastitatis TaxID=2307076 RepID=A0ABS9W6P6_9PROT|nr:PAS domain S-box protein [Pseudoroseomonas vastitatis]